MLFPITYAVSPYSASRSCGFTPAEISSNANRIGISAGTNIGVEALERKKFVTVRGKEEILYRAYSLQVVEQY